MPYVKHGQNHCRILELGCGNGRDALYFSRHGAIVDGVDISTEAIDILNSNETMCTCGISDRVPCKKTLHFFACDFSTILSQNAYDIIYSRFTLHAVDSVSASRAMCNSFVNLKVGGIICIEVRSVLDPLYGQGTQVFGERDAFITSHYRRFVRMSELLHELESIGFMILYSVESSNLSVHNQDNPVLIRVIAKKRCERP
jgi:SAM-dependent methyltransferase